MLQSLHIENIAVVARLDLDLADGFSVLTGETGAGKSVIIDSIRLLLGGKGDRELVRYGEDRAFVSGIFVDLSEKTLSALAEFSVFPDEEGYILIERTLFADGKGVSKINGRTVTLSALREVSVYLLDIHGQNASSLLMREETQRAVLDSFGDIEPLLVLYRPVYEKLLSVRKAIRDVSFDEAEKARMIDVLRYQTAEIESFAPKLHEEDRLLEKRSLLRNSEKISRQAGFVYKALRGAEKGSVHYLLSKSLTALEGLQDIIPAVKEYERTLQNALSELDDVAEEVYRLSEEDGDPVAMLDKIEARLNGYAKLHRKYGVDTEGVLAFFERSKAELERYESADKQLLSLRKEEASVLKEIEDLANAIRVKRLSAAQEMVKEITAILEFLDMPKVEFHISVAKKENGEETVYGEYGSDKISFLVAANPGEAPQPLKDVASGGELQRIMLAVKSVIASNDGIPTVIYDEADAGVSGKTARKIGFKLKESSKEMQVLCVTHSAQIASLADRHLLIEKKEKNGRAETEARLLSFDERIEELSRILGGIEITDVQRKAALDLLNNTEN